MKEMWHVAREQKRNYIFCHLLCSNHLRSLSGIHFENSLVVLLIVSVSPSLPSIHPFSPTVSPALLPSPHSPPTPRSLPLSPSLAYQTPPSTVASRCYVSVCVREIESERGSIHACMNVCILVYIFLCMCVCISVCIYASDAGKQGVWKG